MRDPYVYSGTHTLINNFGIKDEQELQEAETAVFLVQRTKPLPVGNFDYAHLKAIHAHYFEKIYAWAGEERTVNITKGGSYFAHTQYIAKEMTKLFEKLKEDHHLQKLSKEKFCGALSYYFNEINALHPFREGNGRTQRAFCQLLAKEAGYQLDWRKVSQEIYTQASIDGFTKGDYAPMAKIFQEITAPIKKEQQLENEVDRLAKNYIDLLTQRHQTKNPAEIQNLEKSLDTLAMATIQQPKVLVQIYQLDPKLSKAIESRALKVMGKEQDLDLSI